MKYTNLLLYRSGRITSFIRCLFFFVLAFFIFIIDQSSKFWVVSNLNPGEARPLLDGLLYLTFVRNPGAAFGLFPYKTPYFVAVSLIMIVFTIITAFLISPRFKIQRAALALVLGGAVGNLYDRLQTGYVVDFIDFCFWPVFNFADMAIVVGALLLAMGLIAHPGLFKAEDPLQGGG